jgi:hypothetical protein
MIAESCGRQHIAPDQLVIHADRGPSMTSQPVALLLATLGVVPSHSRPHVSNDNPFSEAQFKTLKYRPDFPDRFGAYEDAEAFCQRFFPWYNTEHRHGALGLMTPSDIHSGLAAAKWEQRAAVLRAAYAAHPERSPAASRSPHPCRRRRGSTSPPRRPPPGPTGPAHEHESQISEVDCLIRLDIYRAARHGLRAIGSGHENRRGGGSITSDTRGRGQIGGAAGDDPERKSGKECGVAACRGRALD